MRYILLIYLTRYLRKVFPNALLKLRETEIFAFAFFGKTAENENLRYVILLRNCGKCKFSFFIVTCKVNLIPFRALLHVKFSLHIFFVYISISNVLAYVTLTVLLKVFGEIALKKLISFPVIISKTKLKIGIIYQCYIYFHDQNVMIYVIHKSMFCNSQITPHMDHYHIRYT